jgi:hypothetical protein
MPEPPPVTTASFPVNESIAATSDSSAAPATIVASDSSRRSATAVASEN